MTLLRELAAGNMDYFILLLLRVSGLVFSSPIFGRTNIPMLVKTGFTGAITIFFYYSLPRVPLFHHYDIMVFFLLCASELIFGMILGYVQNLFLSIAQTAGVQMDMQIGFSMVNMLDPQFGSSPITGSIINMAYLLCFFLVDGHLRLVQIMYLTVTQIPIGAVTFNPNIGLAAAQLMSQSFLLAFNVALPVIGAGLVGEVCMGILIKVVPEVNMFVVGIPMKITMGLFILFISMPILVDFSNVIFDDMFASLEQMFALLASSG